MDLEGPVVGTMSIDAQTKESLLTGLDRQLSENIEPDEDKIYIPVEVQIHKKLADGSPAEGPPLRQIGYIQLVDAENPPPAQDGEAAE